jgi:hypothetical protein
VFYTKFNQKNHPRTDTPPPPRYNPKTAKINEVGMACSGIILIQNFVKICQLVRKFKNTHTREYGDLISVLYTPKKEKWAKNLSCYFRKLTNPGFFYPAFLRFLLEVFSDVDSYLLNTAAHLRPS